MTRVLFVGQKPETVDFSDPSLPPGFDAEKINAGIALGVSKIEERGWQGDTCMITPDATGSALLEIALKAVPYDCVVIGAGLRLPHKSLALFETMVKIIHKSAPNATIAFNTRPEDTADAAARQLEDVHHLHANTNFAVIDFFWDRLLGTYRDPDTDLS